MGSASSEKPICVDLFCGAGGLSAGLRMAGFRSVLAADIDPNVIRTYRHNHPDTTALQVDIAKLTAEEIIDACDGRELDLLAGGPSCQGYSTHGKRNADDPRNFLFKHFIRLARDVRPKWVLIENVKGLLTYKSGEFRTIITEELESVGYRVGAKVLCAADYGVPQLRHRIFFLATRTDAEVSFPDPTHCERETAAFRGLKPYVTVGDAISDLPLMRGNLKVEEWDYAHAAKVDFQRYARQYNPTLTLHQANGVSKQAGDVLRFIGEGQGLRSVPPEHLPDRFKRMRKISNGELRRDCTTLYFRLSRQAPAYTITCFFRNVASGAFTHPIEDRSLSYREAARLMSFQDRYRFIGPKLPMQIGNAVPPLLAKAVGQHILGLLAEYSEVDEELAVMA